jgi:hypothetical protein
MIVRREATTFLLITQLDHAQLAEEVVAAIRTEPAVGGHDRDAILLAAREHDNGWAEVDAAPLVDPATGAPQDFMAGPARLKHDLWLRGVTRVARMDPRAGALVAEHAITVYGYRANEREWAPFFASITAMRDALLQRLGASSGPARQAFDAGYRCVRLGDSFSLQFCNGWAASQTTLGYRAGMVRSALCITPDPFGGAVVPLRVIGRRIPLRRYDDDADLRAALAGALPEVITGEAQGEPCAS